MRSLPFSRVVGSLCAIAALIALIGAAAPAANAETVVSFTFDDGLSSAPAAGSVMTSQGIKATFYIITGEVGASGFLTWSNVAKLAAEGHEIGAHTVTHPDLPLLTPSEQEEEICGSREQLEEHGYQPHTFAYPHGDFNLETIRLVQACGFSSARLFGTFQGGSSPSGGTSIYPEPYTLPNVYELSTQGSPERRVELQDLKNDFEWGQGGWVIIALHGVCPSTLNPKESECAGLYGPTAASVLEQYAKWLGEQPKTIIRTVGQVVEDPVLPTTTISCNSSACSGPYPSTVTVGLNATDSNLPVEETRYTTNGSEPTTSSTVYTGTFQVSSTKTVKYRSWDIRGNAEAVHSQTITIDTPPVTTIESEPSDPSNEATATFKFSANKSSTFECSLDGGAYSSCSSPYKTGTLAQGSNTFTVRAKDTAGSKETSPPSYTWTVDSVAPVATIESEPASLTKSTSASITFLANESSTFECELDGAGFKACSSPFTATGLADGQHTFKVKATDTVGNKGSAVSYAWTVDTTPPVTTIEGEPASLTKSTSASITFLANESSTFECELDGAGFKACSSPFAATGLSDGQHTFKVRATDTAGNKGSGVSYSWMVDTTPPVVTIEGEPASLTKSTSASITFSASESATFECELDGAGFKACSSPFTATGLADGQHTFKVKATDPVGNKGSAVSYSWTVDTTAPVTTIENKPASLTKSTSASITFSANESATFECELDEAGFKSCSSPFAATGLSDGQHTFKVRATDTVGNKGSAVSYSWMVDTTPPVTTIESKPALLTKSTTASISFSANESSTFECELDGASFKACSSPFTATGLADGQHTFRVRATDAAGNKGNAVSYSWTVDTIPPVTTIESKPALLTKSTSASISFSANESATFECELDGASFKACSSPFTASGLADGQHTFKVRGTDTAGNQAAPVSYSWTVDTTPPVTTIESKPASLTKNTSATIVFSANEAATFECQLGSSGFKACTSPYSTNSLSDGLHTFEVRATDTAGNKGSVVSYPWTVDTTPPVVSIESKPMSLTNSTSASISFSASESATFECELDGAGFKACSSPYGVAGLGEGQHTFKVRATDTAGNEAAPIAYSWTVDTTPPVTTIESKPATLTKSTSASITFSASESATFECKLDSGAFKTCASPYAATGLGDGQHTFTVRATDTSGNKEVSPPSYSWTVDTTPPVTTIENKPASLTKSTSASITFSANESATFECELDGAGFKSCSSPFTANGLSDGQHTFRVRAIDLVANVGSTASYSWTVDTTTPITTIENKPSSLTKSTSASISFSADESATFECELDGGGFKACSSPFMVTGLSDGQHTFSVRATDAVNNKGSAASYSWTVDTTMPITTIENKPPSLTKSTSASISFSADESASFECELDGAGFKPCSSPFTATGLSDGQHTFKVKGTDAAGNEAVPVSYSWTVDTTPPVVSIENKPPSLTKSTSASISFSADESASFECELDGGGFKACSSPFMVTGLSDGQHTFKVKGTDSAGNEAAPASYSWMVDTTTPVTTIESTPPVLTNKRTATITFSADETATFECSLDGSAYSACSSPYQTPTLADGPHTFAVRAKDKNGVEELSPPSYSWTVDTTPPITTIESNALSDTESGDVSVTFSANETATFECSLDGGAYSACNSPYAAHGLGVGFHTLRIRATDLAGNIESQPVSYTWTVVAAPPSPPGGGPVTPPPGGGNGGGKEESPPKEQLSGGPRVVLAARLGGAVRHGGLPLELYCPGSCTARVVVGLVKTAKNGHETRLRVLATATTQASDARTLKLKVKLAHDSAGSLGKAQRRRVRLQVSVTVHLADGSTHQLRASAAVGARLFAWLR